jgi:hypothetical protein
MRGWTRLVGDAQASVITETEMQERTSQSGRRVPDRLSKGMLCFAIPIRLLEFAWGLALEDFDAIADDRGGAASAYMMPEPGRLRIAGGPRHDGSTGMQGVGGAFMKAAGAGCLRT